MNAYEAKYKKQYQGFNAFGKADVTAVSKLAQLINSQWYYSWHWPEDVDKSWKDQVTEDLNKEFESASQRIKDLELAKKILEQIEV